MHEGCEDIPFLLFGGRERRTDCGEVLGAGLGAESAGDFLPQFHHARIALGLGVGEWHIRIAQEAQHILFALTQAREEIVTDASRPAATALRASERGLSPMEVHPLVHNGIIATLDADDETRLERSATLASKVCGVAGAAQPTPHP